MSESASARFETALPHPVTPDLIASDTLSDDSNSHDLKMTIQKVRELCQMAGEGLSIYELTVENANNPKKQ